jgi:hypothetical protein
MGKLDSRFANPTHDLAAMRGIISARRRLDFMADLVDRARHRYRQPGDTALQTDQRLAEALGWPDPGLFERLATGTSEANLAVVDQLTGLFDKELPLMLRPLTDEEVITRYRNQFPEPDAS